MNHGKVASNTNWEFDHLRSNKQLGQVSLFPSGIGWKHNSIDILFMCRESVMFVWDMVSMSNWIRPVQVKVNKPYIIILVCQDEISMLRSNRRHRFLLYISK